MEKSSAFLVTGGLVLAAAACLLVLWEPGGATWKAPPGRDGKPGFSREADSGTPSLRERFEKEGVAPGGGFREEKPGIPAAPEKAVPEKAVEDGLFLQVRSEDGVPVEGAAVRLFRRPRHEPLARAVTNGRGETRFSPAREGDEIAVAAEGFLSLRFPLREGPWPRPWTAVLPRGEPVLDGIVLDEHELPVRGAALRMTFGSASESGRETVEGETDADGCFRLVAGHAPVRPFEAVITILHPAYCFLGQERPFEVREEPGSITFRVHRWGGLRLAVYDGGGRSIRGARPSLAGPPEAPDRFRLPGIPKGGRIRIRRSSGPAGTASRGLGDGSFGEESGLLIETVPPLVPLWLVVDAPDRAGVERFMGTFQPGEVRSMEVRLGPPAAVPEAVFRLAGRDGSPPAGAKASFGWSPGQGMASHSSCRVKPDGTFRIWIT